MLESVVLEAVVLESQEPARYAVIWLHGLGADGHDFAPAVPALALPGEMAVKFVFPHAPVRPVTINGGMPMRSWYDILAMGQSREVDEAQLGESSRAVEKLIEGLNAEGIPCERIFLVGFSQGGAVAYHTALRYPRRLAGLASLSTYRVGADNPDYAPHPSNRDLPIFVAHGDWDSVVPVSLGRGAYQSLQDQGYLPSWQSYPMDHEVCIPQLQALGRWMAELSR